MKTHLPKTKLSMIFAVSLGVFLIYGIGSSSAVKAENLGFIRIVDTDDLFNREFFSRNNSSLSGIAFPPGAQTLLFLNQSGGAKLELVIPPIDINSKMTRISIDISDPINITFDTKSSGAKGFDLFRLFFWSSDLDQLICIKSGSRNVIKPSSRRDVELINKVDSQSIGVGNPQGMTLDPDTGVLYLLGGSGQQIISIKRKIGHQCNSAEILQIIDIPLSITGKLRGLAFNPTDKHLYVMNSEKRKLFKLALNGKLISSIDLTGHKIGLPDGMIFGPSLDRTDHVSIYHLYLVINQNHKSELTEWVIQ